MGVPVVVLGLTAALGAPAQAARPAVTFTAGPSVTDGSVSLGYSLNRQAKAIATRSCSVDDATTHLAVSCGTLPTRGPKTTDVSVAVGGLADGTYTFTVRVTLTDGGKASATSAPFTITQALTLDQAHLPYPDEDGALDAAAFCDDQTHMGQSFTAGRTGLLKQVSVPGTLVGDYGNPDRVSSLSVDIYATGGDGLPAGSSLGHGTYTGPGADDLSLPEVSLAEPVLLAQGTVYVLTWAASGGCDALTAWRFFAGWDGYPGGQAMFDEGSGWEVLQVQGDARSLDFYFQTWMSS